MRLIDADLFMQRIESYNTLDEMDKALYNFALHEIVCMPTVDVLKQIRAEIEQAADKQFQIAMGVSDLNERYAHIQMENAYRHSLSVIDKYKAESEE